MSTSEFERKKHLLWNVAGTVVLAGFGAIYERFSHEVYSYFMIYAFAFPLLLGVLPYALLLFGKADPGKTAFRLWNSGIATLAVGSLFRGVLEIFGTTNRLWIVYPVAGAILLLAGVAAALLHWKKDPEKS